VAPVGEKEIYVERAMANIAPFLADAGDRQRQSIVS